MHLLSTPNGAGYENWMPVILGKEPSVLIESEEAGKPAEAVENPRRVRAFQKRHHPGQALLVEIEIEPGIAVGEFPRFGFAHRSPRLVRCNYNEPHSHRRRKDRPCSQNPSPWSLAAAAASDAACV